MRDERDGTGIIIFAGRFGSGKTEAAINYALRLIQSRQFQPRDPEHSRQGHRLGSGTPQGTPQPLNSGHQRLDTRMGAPPCAPTPASQRAILIDLDVVTPYFRSREMVETMQKQGVQVIAPSIVGQQLDTPAITPQILGAIQQPERPVVLDLGGDRQGARALGQFSAAVRQRGYTMHFVVNPYRPFTGTLQGLTSSISEIEASARLRIGSLVSNPNLMSETTAEHIIEGHAKTEEFARALKLPIALVCLERRWVAELGADRFAQPILTLDRYFVMPWE
jgi:hypothetical protein